METLTAESVNATADTVLGNQDYMPLVLKLRRQNDDMVVLLIQKNRKLNIIMHNLTRLSNTPELVHSCKMKVDRIPDEMGALDFT